VLASQAILDGLQQDFVGFPNSLVLWMKFGSIYIYIYIYIYMIQRPKNKPRNGESGCQHPKKIKTEVFKQGAGICLLGQRWNFTWTIPGKPKLKQQLVSK
jgi:hypothetical protein